jgi:hypothetical protein
MVRIYLNWKIYHPKKEVGAKSSQISAHKKIWICHKKGKLIWRKILETNNIFSNKGNRWEKKKFAVYVHWHCVDI